MRKLIPIALMLACTTPLASMAADKATTDKKTADKVDIDTSSDRRMRVLQYDESDVYTITTKPGFQTNIVFGGPEEIHTISVGDRSFWQIIPTGNRLFIRPLNEGVVTNMTVITNRHSYQFDLKSISPDDDGGNIYVAKFEYPKKKPRLPAKYLRAPAYPTTPAPVPAGYPPVGHSTHQPPLTPTPITPPAPITAPAHHASTPANPPLTATVKPLVHPLAGTADGAPTTHKPAYHPVARNLGVPRPVGPNFSYTFSGPDNLAPRQVYDDGKSTYIRYNKTGKPLPNIYLVNSQGVEHPTSYYIQGDAMVVDKISPKLALKTGSGTVYIYNELLTP